MFQVGLGLCPELRNYSYPKHLFFVVQFILLKSKKIELKLKFIGMRVRAPLKQNVNKLEKLVCFIVFVCLIGF